MKEYFDYLEKQGFTLRNKEEESQEEFQQRYISFLKEQDKKDSFNKASYQKERTTMCVGVVGKVSTNGSPGKSHTE